MNKKVILIFLVVLSLSLVGFFEFIGLNVLFTLGNQGGNVYYRVNPVDTFVQCWDADPTNHIMVKSVCHAQYYHGGNKDLSGMNAVDYCQSKVEVVDYFCGTDFSCQKLVSSCPKGYICADGQCVKEESEILKLLNFKELTDSFERMFDI